MRGSIQRMSTIALFAWVCGPVAASAGEKAAKIEFNRDIRPMLSEKCFQCHGPDASHRKAKLRLDIEEGCKVIAAGKPGESELYARITSNETDKRMPPAKSGKSLTKNEVELIRRWIEQGAE